jgi:GNAT superfamily N-acetyltransferase
MVHLQRIALTSADPQAAEAQSCLAQYYAELARVFEGGFDPKDQAYAGTDKATPPVLYCVLASMEGGAVGCGFLQWQAYDHTAEIKRMWVSPQLRGQGVARAILLHLEDHAAALGFAAVRLDTNRALAGARAMYLRSGYEEIARYNDNPYAHHWFGKSLRPTGAR